MVSLNSLQDWIYDEIDQGIDLSYESLYEETLEQIREENPNADDTEIEEITRESMEMVEFDTRTVLFGDWIKVDGKYQIDTNGKEGYSAEYNSGMGTVCVEYSRTTKLCNNTSPCYVMADGSGPCGDLDAEGDAVLAYTLPVDFL